MHSAKAMADGRGRSRLLLACISTKFRGTKAEFCMCRVMTDSHVRLVVHNKSRNRKVEKSKIGRRQSTKRRAHSAFLNYGPRVSASMALVGELPLAVNTADNMWDDDSTVIVVCTNEGLSMCLPSWLQPKHAAPSHGARIC